jgi:hypothetical protein
MTTPESAAARELARQLLDRETAAATELPTVGVAMQQACTRVSENLRRSVGDHGYHALLVRALARTEPHEPLLKDIRRSDAAGIRLDVVPAVDGHGVATVRAALEALFAALVDILSDLIGTDMVRNLLIYDDSWQRSIGRTRQ